jgi:hypothetical protein
MVSSVLDHSIVSAPLTIQVTLKTLNFCVSVTAIVDSGSAGNFISGKLCQDLNLPQVNTPKSYSIYAVTGELISQENVTTKINPIQLCVENTHQELFEPFVLQNSQTDLILGRPWLIRHQPTINWQSGKIKEWGCACSLNRAPLLTLSSESRSPAITVSSTSIESPTENLSTNIPACYSSFSDVFNPVTASKLPPHRHWDCAIDLVPEARFPKGRIYSLSIPEQESMRKYIKEALDQGYIRPSTSPAAASFFFVAKKDGGLRPCIDYRALN